MHGPSRRDATKLMGLAAASAAVVPTVSGPARAQGAAAPAFTGQHSVKPLPFEADKLRGLSERLITSHWENNYQGSVKALNMIEGKLAEAMRDPDLPAVIYGNLKREELHRTGSVILHEQYFGALGGDGKPGGDVANALANAFGSFGNWREEFRRTGLALSGGSGWSILVYNLDTRSVHNHWAWDHMHNATASVPLLPMDMYEHSYHMDYGTAAAKYVDAFLDNVNWEEVERRYQRAVKMSQV